MQCKRSSKPTNSSRKWPWSGATLTRFCDELAWGWRSRPVSLCCWRRRSHAKRLHIRIATQRMKHIDVGAVHSESAPSPHPQKARRSLPHRDGFPGKGAHKQQDKEGQIADAQQVGDDQKGNPSNIGLTVGTALLAIAAEPNRHADAHGDDRKQQQTAPASTRTIYGRLSASPHRRATPIIFEHYSAMAC